MLYAVQCCLERPAPVEPSVWLKMVQVSMKQVQAMKQQGRILFHGGLAGREAGLMIVDVPDHEHLQQSLVSLPIWPHMTWRIEPLLSTEQVMASLKQAMDGLAGGK